MCGRYNLSTPPDVLAQLYHAANLFEWSPRYNIAPTQRAPVVRAAVEAGPKEGSRRINLLRWGLIPHWAQDEAIGSRMINARAESAAEKPAFRAAFRARRCIVPASGFYEWKKTGRAKQPFHIHRTDGQPLAFAGLWERWEKGAEPIETFTILTTDAMPSIEHIHNGMPVVLANEDAIARWLDGSIESADELAPLLAPAPDEVLAAEPISTFVNSPKNEGPAASSRLNLRSPVATRRSNWPSRNRVCGMRQAANE